MVKGPFPEPVGVPPSPATVYFQAGPPSADRGKAHLPG